uniref:Rho guanine nucleotide exchange factor 2-like n=1 Tax=Gouania willdenowi TaxID=441366 RepID=A0A8C5GKL0_GOUWI
MVHVSKIRIITSPWPSSGPRSHSATWSSSGPWPPSATWSSSGPWSPSATWSSFGPWSPSATWSSFGPWSPSATWSSFGPWSPSATWSSFGPWPPSATWSSSGPWPPSATWSSSGPWSPSATWSSSGPWSPSATWSPSGPWSPSATWSPTATWSPSDPWSPSATWSSSGPQSHSGLWSPSTRRCGDGNPQFISMLTVLCLQNKDKERLKESRSNNGHLFTSITVCSTTLCSSCNRSFTSKEALSCPACNATIHNRCRDSLASCAKMKQRQQKLVKNSSALQNVTMRSKTPVMKERPSSAIYPSDSLRQSLLGSRRVRSGLGLAKSVSTNNIAGLRGAEESVGLRRILSQSTESLNFRSRTWSMESLTDDGEWWWSPLLEELKLQGSCVQSDSWSSSVDQSYLQTLHRDLIRQQDVIYELIQTEFHHVRTLRIMEGVYRRGLQEEVRVESSLLHSVFPCLDRLLELHNHFLSELLRKRQEGLIEGSNNNYTIRGLGELLVTQFSGQRAEDMKKVYSEFCSRHPKAVKIYKDVLSRDRRLQQFIRRVCRGPLLRRHGVQECILLVTQRITKYPVLLQRILDHTKGNDREPLSRALALMKDLVSSVDQEVLELSRCGRLQEVMARLDPRAQTEVQDGGVFIGGELLRRKLLHDGALMWKLQGSRMKDVQVLLMSDILVFLQEKDQKLTFASLVSHMRYHSPGFHGNSGSAPLSQDKSPVVSLTNLIVRDIANQERGLYLISNSTPPVMYELHAASKDERRTWMSRIQEAAHR